MITYNRLSQTARNFADYAKYNINSEKRGISVLSKDITQIANTICWNAEDWMLGSFKAQWAKWACESLEAVALEGMELGYINADQMIDEAWLDMRADSIVRMLAAEAARTIYYGIESSSNAMTILESKAKVDAAKSALETLCGIQRLYDHDNVNAMIDSMHAREAAQEEERAKKPAKLEVFKREKDGGGEYVARSLNHRGDYLDFYELGQSRKGNARVEAQGLAKSLSAKHGTSIIIEGL